MTESTEVLAWHFLCDDRSTGEGHLLVEPGQILRVDPPIIPCQHGLHASVRPLDALGFAPGAMVQRVILRGDIVEHEGNKHAASERECLWMADATRTLHEFAIWCAEQALTLLDEPDPRSLNALVVKRRWLDGEATDEELDAARDAAWAAAWAAQNQHLESMLILLAPVEQEH